MIKPLLRKKYILPTLLVSLFSANTFAATIYSEDFAGQNGKGIDGAGLNDVSGGGWTLDVVSSNLFDAEDFIKVENEALNAQDVSGITKWLSPIIDISSFTNLTFSFDAAVTRGRMEASDSVEFFFIVDGSLVANKKLVDDFSALNAFITETGSFGDGSSLQILAELNNNAVREKYAIDNILIQGDATGGGPPTPIPEPTTLALLGLGLASIGYRRKKVV
ncbi:MAG: PEP-CTERM sorting domain-containing protein [Methyloprofundus sp.]|nr:PEP-CTERM sorting domain-containing protein [Methyloprofundus sp.]